MRIEDLLSPVDAPAPLPPAQPEPLPQPEMQPQPQPPPSLSPPARARTARAPRARRAHPSHYVCPYPGCARTSAEASNIRAHMRTHTGETPYACRCGKRFRWKSSLSYHQKAVHSSVRPHRCAACGKSFIEPRKLALHRDWCAASRARARALADHAAAAAAAFAAANPRPRDMPAVAPLQLAPMPHPVPAQSSGSAATTVASSCATSAAGDAPPTVDFLTSPTTPAPTAPRAVAVASADSQPQAETDVSAAAHSINIADAAAALAAMHRAGAPAPQQYPDPQLREPRPILPALRPLRVLSPLPGPHTPPAAIVPFAYVPHADRHPNTLVYPYAGSPALSTAHSHVTESPPRY